MSTATVGTGTITLGAAVSGYLTFANAGVANADIVDYGIKDGANSETGTGTYTTSGTTLTRTVTKSTNSNAAISLSGSAEVYITARAETLNDASLLTTGTLSSAVLPAGARVLLATLTASNSANLADTTSLTSTYKSYEIVFESILPATTSTTCQFKVNSAGVQSTVYVATVFFGNTAGISTTPTSVTTFIPVSSALHVSNTGPGVNGIFRVSNPSQTTSPKMWYGDFVYPSTTGTIELAMAGGYWNGGNGAITGFQVDFSSGNITSGVIRVYGLT